MPPAFRLAGPVFDAADPGSLAAFYERLTGWPIVRREGPRPGKPALDGWALLRAPDGSRKIEVQWEPNYRPPTWPSVAGDQLMMVHLDFGVDDLSEAVAWALDCGAVRAAHQPQEDVVVLLDPEGHPFCLFEDGMPSS